MESWTDVNVNLENIQGERRRPDLPASVDEFNLTAEKYCNVRGYEASTRVYGVYSLMVRYKSRSQDLD